MKERTQLDNAEKQAVREDFDRLALHPEQRWTHNNHYHGYLLKHLPQPCPQALEIGCGTGEFSRWLSLRCGQVWAVDLSPLMVQVARQQSIDLNNTRYEVADATRLELPENGLDCIATIATLHHLPLDETLVQVKRALRPGGVFLALDLYEEQGWRDALRSMIAFPFDRLYRLAINHRLHEPVEVRAAWDLHASHDFLLPLSEISQRCAAILPGVLLKQHWFWRYSIVWQKPFPESS